MDGTGTDWARLLTLQDYNTRVVLIGVTLLGFGAGVMGTFMLLRKRAMMGDALAHATLPGIALAFILVSWLGGDGKSLGWLLAGAALTGVLGMGSVLAIRHGSRLKEDAALGIVLSVFFGLGVVGLSIAQQMPTGNAAGLESFIYGKTASMLARDAWLTAGASVVVAAGAGLLFKEFGLVCFDQDYAAAQGWPVLKLDAIMMVLVVLVTVIGLQAVGLILVVALLILPAAAARFWTERLPVMTVVAGVLGAFSGLVGAAISAATPRAPAGAVIVLVAAAMFGVSLLCGRSRGMVWLGLDRYRLTIKTRRQHLLRALYEWSETHVDAAGMTESDLMAARSWSRGTLRATMRWAESNDFARRDGSGVARLTDRGAQEACRLVRNHRLWELYLVTHADVAPSHVDRDADQLEHVLGREMVDSLQAALERDHPDLAMPPSPHAIKLARADDRGGRRS